MTSPNEDFPQTPVPGTPPGLGESTAKGPIRYMDDETFQKAHKKVSEYFASVLKKLAE